MTKTPVRRLVRVRATDHPHICEGCVFGTASTCGMPRDARSNNPWERARKCIERHGHDERNWIFIQPTKPAKAAYLALVMEHGREQ